MLSHDLSALLMAFVFVFGTTALILVAFRSLNARSTVLTPDGEEEADAQRKIELRSIASTRDRSFDEQTYEEDSDRPFSLGDLVTIPIFIAVVLILSPCLIVIAVFGIAVAALAAEADWRQRKSLTKEMKRANRYLPNADTLAKGGTFIVQRDFPRQPPLWWTPDDVKAMYPQIESMLSEDQWGADEETRAIATTIIEQEYLNRDSGKAHLVGFLKKDRPEGALWVDSWLDSNFLEEWAEEEDYWNSDER